MKKKLGTFLAAVMLLASISTLAAFATEGVDVPAAVSKQKIKLMELVRGIESKDDSEIFSVVESVNSIEFDFVEESDDLKFSYAEGEKAEGVEFTKIDRGFRVNEAVLKQKRTVTENLKVELPDAWTIDYTRKEDGTVANGSLAIFNELGEPVASTGLATAIDANGKEVEAEIVLYNESIGVKLVGNEISYPVNISYGVYAANASRSVTDYFHYAGFNLVYDRSLTLGPRYFDEGSVIECTNAWDAVYDLFFPYSTYWTTSTQTESMNDQYWCHADFAKTKDQWNLEPWRPIVSWGSMVWARCNPE